MTIFGIQIRHRMAPSRVTIDSAGDDTDECLVTCDRHGRVGRHDNSPTAQLAAIRHAQKHRNKVEVLNQTERGPATSGA